MLNTHALTNPSPSDANLQLNTDGLGILREGVHELDRFFFYTGSRHPPKTLLNNPFRYEISTGGYDNTKRRIDGTLSALGVGGILPFPPAPQQQNIGNQVSNDPVPVVNALVDRQLQSPKFQVDRRLQII